MEGALKKALNTTKLTSYGRGGGGCINQGSGYMTDDGPVFVKHNSKEGARVMFDGEFASLEAMAATKTVRVPQPIKVLDLPSGAAALVCEYVEMSGLSKHSAALGEAMARLHLHNSELGKRTQQQEASVHKGDDAVEFVGRFGFHTTTCCGYIPQDNTWEDDWVTFYTRHKLQQQMDLIERDYSDREARDLWSQLLPKIPKFFQDIEIVPSLLHGDLWGGNVAETKEGPVIFDPASFYGHHEYELGIASMFGGFSRAFYNAYHGNIPKAPGFDLRLKLYQLFHYLNHWNHFGSGYRGQSMSIMRELRKA